MEQYVINQIEKIANKIKTGVSSSASITRSDNTTGYSAGTVIGGASSIMEFASIGSAGKMIKILGTRLRIDANAVPSGMAAFVLYLYNASPTNIADGAAYNLPSGDRAKLVARISLTAPVDEGDTLWSEDDNLGVPIKLAASVTSLYGILKTVGAYTPAAETVHTVTLNVIEV